MMPDKKMNWDEVIEFTSTEDEIERLEAVLKVVQSERDQYKEQRDIAVKALIEIGKLINTESCSAREAKSALEAIDKVGK